MDSSEQLRETLVAIGRENARLRVEAAHAALLFRALEALLRVESDVDPFAAVFAALKTVFDFAQAMVLAEDEDGSLACIAAAPQALAGTRWKAGAFFERVMAGRVSVTFSNQDLEEWRAAPAGLSAAQPGLYLPIRVRDRRGLLMLLQGAGRKGFDRNDGALARKFTLLASHALATRDAADAAAELRSKKEIETQNIRFDAALNNMTQGLVMFDSGGRLVVCNEKYFDMFRLSRDLVAPGCGSRQLLDERRKRGTGPVDLNAYVSDLMAAIAGRQVSEQEVACIDGRIFKSVTSPMSDGGWVTTHEEITERRQNEAKVAFLALNDPLTGIANRSHFMERVELARQRLQRHGEPFAILVLDLDKFKEVNDSLGHAAGDALLQEAARRLAASLGDGDVLARLGGDEFAIIRPAPRDAMGRILTSVEMRQNAVVLANRILELIGRPFDIDGEKVVIGTSIGIALAPDDADDPGYLMKQADLALYSVKAVGRNGFAFFDAKMTLEANERRQLENELREGVARNEFELYYQPIIDVASRRMCGVEALVRWRHPRLGLTAPDRFISLAEDTGLIVPLGEWILKTACADAAKWPAHIKVAVNISPVQFKRSNLLEVISGTLAGTGLPPQRLEIEVTERVLLEKEVDHLQVFNDLKALGVAIALDDFGTGYSSLGYLNMFSFDKLKIDKSFTREMLEKSECAAIVSAVINLGRLLNIVILAEGVETPEQFDILRLAGVRQAQGFLFDRPMPASKLKFDEVAAVGSSEQAA